MIYSRRPKLARNKYGYVKNRTSNETYITNNQQGTGTEEDDLHQWFSGTSAVTTGTDVFGNETTSVTYTDVHVHFPFVADSGISTTDISAQTVTSTALTSNTITTTAITANDVTVKNNLNVYNNGVPVNIDIANLLKLNTVLSHFYIGEDGKIHIDIPFVMDSGSEGCTCDCCECSGTTTGSTDSGNTSGSTSGETTTGDSYVRLTYSGGSTETVPFAAGIVLESEFMWSKAKSAEFVGIKKISKQAFYGASGLTSVSFDDSLKIIDEMAFAQCKKLDNVVIPNSVEYIGQNAFLDCYGLKNIVLGNNVKEIQEGAFASCSITGLTIPPSTETLYGSLFGGCSKLKEMIIPNTVKNFMSTGPMFVGCTSLEHVTLGNGVYSLANTFFYNCPSLKSVIFGKNIRDLGLSPFSGCTSLSSLTFYSNTVPSVNYMGNTAQNGILQYPKGSNFSGLLNKLPSGWRGVEIEVPDDGGQIYHEPPMGQVKLTYSGGTSEIINIPYGVIGTFDLRDTTAISLQLFGITYIKRESFTDLKNLENISMTDSVTNIGKSLFSSCESLTGVTLSNQITEIPFRMFYGCTSLQTIKIPDSVEVIGNLSFGHCTSLENIEFGKNVKVIDIWAFDECSALTSITIPSTVEDIRKRAFDECSSLESITLPPRITRMSDELFERCTSLKNIVIPNNVSEIGQYCFMECTSLKDIVIPNNVSKIGKYCFLRCASLNSITCHATTAPVLGSNTFEGVPSVGTLYYPASSDYTTWFRALPSGWTGVEI